MAQITIQICLPNEAQYDALVKAAKAAGQSISGFYRPALLERAGIEREPVTLEEIRRQVADLAALVGAKNVG
jgi:uncharacterized protein (DUF1778 family)